MVRTKRKCSVCPDNSLLPEKKFAKKHRKRIKTDLRRLNFVNDTNFSLFGSHGMSYLRRKVGECYSDTCVSRTLRSGRSEIVLDCISCYESIRWTLMDATVNGEKYKNILEDNLISSVEEHFSLNTGYFLCTPQCLAIE